MTHMHKSWVWRRSLRQEMCCCRCALHVVAVFRTAISITHDEMTLMLLIAPNIICLYLDGFLLHLPKLIIQLLHYKLQSWPLCMKSMGVSLAVRQFWYCLINQAAISLEGWQEWRRNAQFLNRLLKGKLSWCTGISVNGHLKDKILWRESISAMLE